ncbi:uncharacterized protein LOC129744100 [Uranotaenia lowii]|uniref:uncharacterized protein LOC129744100 n=1 Tax=Uranotaenia lowii TaxID=190385 RepID=UPI00247A26A2|nr:uncharacterized protein LOC129744100 [Uranotaenia lowii]
MKFTALITLMVLGVVYGIPINDQEDVSGPKGTQAAEERILDLSRKSRQLLGSAFGYSSINNGLSQGFGGYPGSYSGYSGFSGYPYNSGPYGNVGPYGNGIYSNGLYSNGLGGYNGYQPLNGGGFGGIGYNGLGQQLPYDPYNPIAARGFFPGAGIYRRPY